MGKKLGERDERRYFEQEVDLGDVSSGLSGKDVEMQE